MKIRIFVSLDLVEQADSQKQSNNDLMGIPFLIHKIGRTSFVYFFARKHIVEVWKKDVNKI